jgi:hypothetical protein
MFYMLHASKPDGWCACRDAKLRWQPVAAGGAVCERFATPAAGTGW